ncbi:hypothetical protein D8674_006238 [Pyrus ussuriensis x Pyrus communis]|uniref:Uncharacterized protein n=1 Tax=Pyrus ussuriensis x Pyrus communis TaxID=2448454 RepID=A0A5N5FTV0_9ROSA|nr:hypothetical protein D8674_006236 [Pyrus ussuriensis x Pyrus communis]KAB2606521.1 hypothetical protein D8674_006238 [Pyrus ussuriensis x Pyrus communis]
MDSIAFIVKLTKQIWNQWVKSVNFVEIDHSYSIRFGNLILQGINRSAIILESLQSKDWRAS